MGAILRNGNAAGIDAADPIFHLVDLDMGMTGEEHGPFRQCR